MHIQSIIIVTGTIFLAAASAALAGDGNLSKIDIQAVCRTRQATVDAVFSNQNSSTFESCTSSEQDARNKLLERWGTIPAEDKISCVHPAAYSPSYLEWLGCIVTREYVRALRAERPVAAPPRGPCPTVEWKSDGTIVGVVSCDLLQFYKQL